ncbi:hypothetical protein [Candidatus Nitrospira bockiana]
MKDIRKEVAELTRCFDILLNSKEMETPLNEKERGLLEAYITRFCQKMNLPCEHHKGQQPTTE